MEIDECIVNEKIIACATNIKTSRKWVWLPTKFNILEATHRHLMWDLN